jgi:uncharacterized protein
MRVILEGIVGSHAYGLNREGSDIDRLGVYLEPTVSFLGLNPPTDGNSTRVAKDPDTTHHELGKFCRLALKCNPTITELLWLGEWTTYVDHGHALVGLREDFLWAKGVRNAYLGYATEQFSRIKRRESNDFSSDTKNRTAKHARHLLRLLDQGLSLWTIGKPEVRVSNPDRYFEFGEKTQAGDLGPAEKAMAAAEYEFNQRHCCLRDEPNAEAVESVVRMIRQESM